MPGISVLRLLRVFKMIRLFQQLQSLRILINALTTAVFPGHRHRHTRGLCVVGDSGRGRAVACRCTAILTRATPKRCNHRRSLEQLCYSAARHFHLRRSRHGLFQQVSVHTNILTYKHLQRERDCYRDKGFSLSHKVQGLFLTCTSVHIACALSCVGAVLFMCSRHDEFFGTFSRSIWTLFQVATGDAWSSSVGRSVFPIPTTIRKPLSPKAPCRCLLNDGQPYPPNNPNHLPSLPSLARVARARACVQELARRRWCGWRAA